MKEPILIIKDVVEGMNNAPRFIAGNWTEALKLNSLQSYDKTKDGTRYPLIVLDPNFTITEANETGRNGEFECDFYFIVRTESNYTVVERLENVYEPIINPLINSFFYAMYRSGKFVFDRTKNIEKGYFIGLERENLYYAKNVLNDVVDTVKIKIKLKIR